MRRVWRRLVSGMLTVVMLAALLPDAALAALVDNTPDRNAAILAELTEFWGDEKTAREAMELLLKYGLIDEEGNVLTDWNGTITIREEAVPLTFEEAMELSKGTVTVNGRACDASELRRILLGMEALGLYADGVPAADWELAVKGLPVSPAGLEDALAAAEEEPGPEPEPEPEPAEEPTDESTEGPGEEPEAEPEAPAEDSGEGGAEPAQISPRSAQTQAAPLVTVLGGEADADALLEVVAFLEQYDLLTETGAADDWGLTLPGGERRTNVTELLAMLESGDYDPDAVVTVDGTAITMADFSTMMQIEAEIKRIQETYLSEDVDLTPEQTSSLYSLYEQLSENGIMLYNTQGADDLVFPSGINHNATVSVSLSTATIAGTSGGTVTATYTVSGAEADQEVSFDVYVLPGSAANWVTAKQERVTITGNGSATVSASVSKLPSVWDNTTWNGQQRFYFYATDITNAYFSDGQMSSLQAVNVTNSASFTTSINQSATSSKTVNFSDAQKYFLKNLASHYDWSVTPSGAKADTVFSATSSRGAYDSYYQYMRGAVSFGGTQVANVELGFPGSSSQLDTAVRANESKAHGVAVSYVVNQSNLNNSSFSFFPLASGSSWSTRIAGSSRSNIALTDSMKSAGSVQFTAEGRWSQVHSLYIDKDYDAYLASGGTGTFSVTAGITVKDTTKPTVTGVTFPNATFPTGSSVPITVTFSEPVQSGTVTLTANGVDLSAQESGATSKTLTFLYPVDTVGEARITVTKIAGAKDAAGNTMTDDATSRQSGAILQTVTLVDAIPAGSIQSAKVGDVTYYEATADREERTTATVDVTLTLPTNTDLRNLVLGSYMLDSGDFACAVLAASIDGGETLIPLVFDDRGSPNAMTATVEIDATTLVEQQNFVMEFYTIEVDTDNGNAVTKDDLFFGRYAAFSVNEPVPLEGSSLSIETPGGWPEQPIYVNDPPKREDLTLRAVVDAPEGTTWTQTRWMSGDESVATIDANGVVYPLGAGTVEFWLEAVNGGLTEVYGQQRSDSVSLTIEEGAEPYLRIPEDSMTVRSGDNVTLRWASNLVQKNASYGNNAPTAFTIEVYEGTDTDGRPVRTETVVYDPSDTSDKALWVDGSPNQSYVLEGLDKVSVGGEAAYTIVLSVDAEESIPLAERTYTATTRVYVVSQPVSVRLERPGSLFRTNGQGRLTVDYTLTDFDAGNNAEFELVVTNNATGKVVYQTDETENGGGSFTIDLSAADITDGFRTIYDVSVKAKNTAEKDWSRDSFTLYIYDKDCLDILVQPVTKNGITTVDVNGDTVTMSNEAWIKSLTEDQILALNRDIDLQAAISINYGDHAWGEASDRIRWVVQNSDIAAVNYPQGAYYENIETLPYTSFAPATQFLLSGKNDDKTVVEAIHALAGDALSSSVEITVETLKDKLYLFQFYPVGKATMTYYVNGEKMTHDTDENGRAAIYEADGITSDIYVEANIDGEKYLGTVYQEDLVSQEKDAVSLELYPLNSLNLRKAATLPVYLKNPDGTNYSGAVTVRAGVYRNGVYCAEAMYNTAANGGATINGSADNSVTFTGGRATFYYDLTQFNTNGGADPITAADDVQFVLELRVDGYYPVLFTANGTTNEDDAIRLSERIVNLEEVPEGQENQPFVAKQTLYFSGKESGVSTDVRNKSGKVGPSADYPDVLLSTTVLWWGRENDQTDRSIRYVDSTGITLTGQELAGDYYPFCSMPVSHNTVRLDKAQMEAIGLGDNGVRALSLRYLENGTAVKKETMRWQLIHINVKSALGSKDLLDRLDALGEIISGTGSDGVTTLKNDFLALGISLATATGIDLPILKLQLAPTADPTVFKGLVYIGLNNFEGDNVSGVAADSGRGYDADYFPGLEQIKGLYKQKAAYGGTMGTQLAYAGQMLASNVRQGSGTSKTGDKRISYALQGYFETEVYFDFADNEWKMVVLTGGFTAGGGGGYEWTWNTQVGPVPVFLQLEAGAAGAIEFQAALDHVKNGNDYLTELRLYAYLQAFGGIGFDYAVIALKIGLYGRVGLDATLRWLNAIDQKAQFGAQVNVTGEIGVKFQVEVLFISYEKILWSQPIANYNGTFDQWNQIDDYWEQVKDGNSGNGEILNPGSRRLTANFVAAGYGGDTGIYAADQEAVLQDRDYLSEYRRSYDSSGPSLGGGISLFSFFSNSAGSNVVETLENSYPLASPVLSDDGGYLFYLDDGNDADDATNVRAAVMERNGQNGYQSGARLDDSGYGDSGLKAAGAGENAVAVWSRVTEKPAITEPGQSVTPDVQAGMLNSSDIMAAVRSGSGWKVTNLTEGNGVADLAPVVAANGQRILVAWRQVASSSATDLTNFDARDYIYYSVSEDGGETWSKAEPIYNGTSGAVKGLEAAMLDSGEAAVVFTLQTGEHDADSGEYHQEIAYAIVDEVDDGYDVVRYAQMTDDDNLDENPQVAAVELDGENIFVLGWYCLDSESGESDIRLAAVDGDGNRRTGFVDALSSLIQNAEVGISANFQFSKNADTLDELSILWSDTAAEGEDTTEPAHDYLSAIRFRTEDDQGSARISVTAAQQIAEMGEYTTIDTFNAYVGAGGELYAAIQGTYYDYENLEAYTVDYSDGSTGRVMVAKEKTSVFTVLGAYTDTLRVDSVIPDYANIRKGASVPVQISVTNLGTQPMTKVEVAIGGQTTTFAQGAGSAFVSIAPGETRSLTAFYTVSSEEIQNPTYTVTGTFENGETDAGEPETLILNIPDLGIANSDILVDAVDGDRVLQFNLYNLSDAELAGSGRTVQFNLYTDAACANPIDPAYLTLVHSGRARNGGTLLTVGGEDLAAIDEGSYTLQYKFDLESYIRQEGSEFADADGEVRDGGVTVYAKAWVELPGEDGGEMLEYNSSNNVTAINLESLLKQANGEPTTVTHVLSGDEAGSTVTVTLQNNSMVRTATGNVIVTLLGENGGVLEQQQSYTGGAGNGLITLNTEERKTLGAFTFSQTGADALVTYSNTILTTDAGLDSLYFSNIPGVALESFVEDTTVPGTYRAAVSADDLTGTGMTFQTRSLSATVKVEVDGTEIPAESGILSARNLTLEPGKIHTITVTVTNANAARTYILTVQNNGKPVINIPTGTPESTQYSASTFYAADAAVISLEAAATPEEDSYKLSYQWYSCDANGGNIGLLQDETGSTLTIPNTTNVGVYYYRCQVIRHMLDGSTRPYWSSVASVQINKAGDNSVMLEGSTVTFDNQPHKLAGAEAAKANSILHYSADGGSTWSTTMPEFTAVGVHTVWAYATNPNYEDTPVVTADVVIQERAGILFKLETRPIEDVYDGYPDEIKALYPDAESLAAALTEAMVKTGVSEKDTAVYGAKLLFSLNGGITWIEATADNFPAAGMSVTLPYPEGADRYNYDFILRQLVTDPLNTGKAVGDVKALDVTLSRDGVRFTADCLSALVLGWYPRPATPTYKVVVNDSEHGTVSAGSEYAVYDSIVTITARPDKGYQVGGVTVTAQNGRELTVTDKGGNTYTFRMPAGSVSVDVVFVPVETEPEACVGGAGCPSRAFTDLSASAWYHEAVDYVLNGGIMDGYPGGTFGPDDTLSRAMLAQILYNREGRPAVAYANIFTDVADDAWYSQAVIWANARGIVEGYDGRFSPNDPVTREQLAVMLWRCAGSPAATGRELNFTDADRISGWALDAMRWATEKGVMKGYNGMLNPAGKATRGEAAQMLKNFLEGTDE